MGSISPVEEAEEDDEHPGNSTEHRLDEIRHWRIMPTMVIIETPAFSRLIVALMSDDEYRVLQEALIQRPGLGVVIQGTGGLRKLRWTMEGRGKRGGVRVIYYWQKKADQLYMLYGYPKYEQKDLTAEQKKLLKQIVERW